MPLHRRHHAQISSRTYPPLWKNDEQNCCLVAVAGVAFISIEARLRVCIVDGRQQIDLACQRLAEQLTQLAGSQESELAVGHGSVRSVSGPTPRARLTPGFLADFPSIRPSL